MFFKVKLNARFTLEDLFCGHIKKQQKYLFLNKYKSEFYLFLQTRKHLEVYITRVSIILQSITAKRDGKRGVLSTFIIIFRNVNGLKSNVRNFWRKLNFFLFRIFLLVWSGIFFYIIILQKNVIFFSVWRYPNGFLYYWNDFEISKLTKILN